MIALHIAPDHEVDGTHSASLRMIIVRPPAMCLLPRRGMRSGSLMSSAGLHAIALAALLWLPRLMAGPVVIAQENFRKSDPVILNEPLVLPSLPRLEDRGSSASKKRAAAPGAGAASARPPLSAPAPDYTAPQTIISDVASPVNRIQTILRPDLVAPANLKFPLRLQSAVILPSTAAPVLAPQPPVAPAEPAPLPSPEEAPAITPTVQKPVLTLTPKKGSVIRAKAAPAQNVSPDLKVLPGTNSNALKALVVVNAVQVAPDPATAVPDGQLAGKFVVGPLASAAGSGSSSPASETEAAIAGGAGRSTAPGNGHSSTPGPGSETTAAGKGGLGVSTSPGSGNGGGTGTGVTNGSGPSGAGAGSVSGSVPGISISGGVPGPRAVTANSFPGRPSYPLMIISGGASGGASRDLGVFNRSETVYSVSIPMTEAGGGPDWTMQYALRDPVQTGGGLMVPPIAQKKIAATMKSAAITIDGDRVFITAIIDEKGKLQSLRALRAQDPRSQAAIHALEQWEFLPAELDGKPVASKILVGVAVRLQE